VIGMVGDGSYRMMAPELVTRSAGGGAVQEGVKLVVVRVQNHGFASMSGFCETVGVTQFGTHSRYRGQSGRLDGDILPIDLAAKAASLGAEVLRASTLGSFRRCLSEATAVTRTTVVHVGCEPATGAALSQSWWDACRCAGVEPARHPGATRAAYDRAKTHQRGH
jgi:3D-(3,5/4)-trihydroxycyclohexane-1,2-dione acylhydrolase (decyclizing)